MEGFRFAAQALDLGLGFRVWGRQLLRPHKKGPNEDAGRVSSGMVCVRKLCLAGSSSIKSFEWCCSSQYSLASLSTPPQPSA